ncbi:hypothetical protein ACSFBF_10745 [Variovorax sp. ZT5P49]|uniref:hypothetical protein n=1 Tax=Variovorax sp. ZT5P49 TaxID=3443733 RepID=UPI003F4851F7
MDEGTMPEDVAPDPPHPPPDLPPPPEGALAIQAPTNAIALIPVAHQPIPVGLLSMPVEIIQLILFNLGPALIPALGALRCSSHWTRNMTMDALAIDPHLSSVPIFANMLFTFQAQWQRHLTTIDRQLTVQPRGSMADLVSLARKLTALRKECLMLVSQLEGLLSSIDKMCGLLDRGDPMRRATITSNLIMLRDRARAMKDQIAAKATALGLKLKTTKDKQSLKRL